MGGDDTCSRQVDLGRAFLAAIAAAGTTDAVLRRVAVAICRADPHAPSCVMDEHPKRAVCGETNCHRFVQATAALEALKEPADGG